MTQEAHKRRLQDTLIISGTGVLAFSIWTLAKTALVLALIDERMLLSVVFLGAGIPLSVFYLVIGLFLLVDISARAFVGVSARAEGNGKKKGNAYLVVAVLAALGNALTAIVVMSGAISTLTVLDVVVAAAIELTSLAALAMVVYCAISLRRMGRATG